MRHKRHGSSTSAITVPQQIKYLATGSILPNPRNARTHSAQQIQQIARSIERFGFNNPVLIDQNNRVIAGHGRVAAAKLLGHDFVPTLRIEHLSDEEKRAYIIADNKLAEKAGWDTEILAIEFQSLGELGFELELTGFELPEIEIILDAKAQTASAIEDDPLPDLVPNRVRTTPGDLWVLGEHRLFCGDARHRESFEELLKGERAQLAFVDPPYNVPIRGHVSGKGRVKHREFAQASGEKTPAQFTKFLEECFGLLSEHSDDGSIHFVCTDWRHIDEMLTAGKRVYGEFKNLAVWTKTNPGMGSFYRSQHELIFVWKNGRGKHINNIDLGRYGRNRSNVWTYAGANSFGPDRFNEGHASDRQAGRSCGGCHPRLFASWPPGSRFFRRQRNHADRVRKNAAKGAPHRDRSGLLRPHRSPVAETHWRKRRSCQDRRCVQRYRQAQKDRRRRMSRKRRKSSGSKTGYAVGYGKPPVSSRFKPGMSGNAKGRPKNSKNLKTLIRQALTAKISIREGSSNRRVSKIEGVVLRQLENALKGEDRAAMAVIKMAMQMGFLEDAQSAAAETVTTTDEEIMRQLLAIQKRRGSTSPKSATDRLPYHRWKSCL